MFEWVEITEISYIEEEAEVYNLEVEDNPNYFAEGILVHNCFCREMEEGLYNRYYDGWSRDLSALAIQKILESYLKKPLEVINPTVTGIYNVLGMVFRLIWGVKQKPFAMRILPLT